MFTGLVQAVGKIAQALPGPTGLRLVIDPAGWEHQASLGDSICVSGCCLTIAQHPADLGGRWAFDLVPETLAKTTLGRRAVGDRVNLEHALRASDLLGGHLVQGHVDATGVVERISRDGEWRVRVRAPEGLKRYLTPKGSICVDGVSLTLAHLDGPTFDLTLIPTTLAKTTLAELREGDAVNIECDPIAKMVVGFLHGFTAAGPA